MAETYIKNLGKVCITPEGVWNKNAQYNRLCLVSLTGEDGLVYSYISRKEVPAGIEIGNTDYWQLFANSFSVENWGVGEDGYIYIGGVKTNYKIGLNDALTDEVVNLLSDRLADLVAGKVDQVIGSKLQQILTEGVKVQVEPTGDVEVECVCGKDGGSSGGGDDEGDSGGSGNSDNEGGSNEGGSNEGGSVEDVTITIGNITNKQDRTVIQLSKQIGVEERFVNPIPIYSDYEEVDEGYSFIIQKGYKYKIIISTPYSSTEQNVKGISDTYTANKTETKNFELTRWDPVQILITGDTDDNINIRYNATNSKFKNSPVEYLVKRGDLLRIIAFKDNYVPQVIVDELHLQNNVSTAINLTPLEEGDFIIQPLSAPQSLLPRSGVVINGTTISASPTPWYAGGHKYATVYLLISGQFTISSIPSYATFTKTQAYGEGSAGYTLKFELDEIDTNVLPDVKITDGVTEYTIQTTLS